MSVVKEGWTYKKLGEVCEVVSGSTPKTNVPEYWGNGHYWVTPAEITDSTVYIDKTERQITDEALAKTNLQLMPVGTVLLSSRAPIGKVAITNVEMYCNQGFKNCICSDNLYNKYLFYFFKLKKDYLNSLGRGATFKEISKSIVEGISIPIPPLPAQQSIVSELDKINELIALKKSQLKDLDTLAQSIFYEMFGDPVTNEKGWEVKKLSDLSKEKLSYGSGASAIQYDGETRYVRITDIYDNGDLNDDIVSPSVFDKKYLLNVGDILFARSGATVGKTYLHKVKDGKCIYAGYLIRFIPKIECVLPIYVFALTKTHYYRLFISNTQRAVAQPNINAKQYGDLSLPLPPISLQHQFAERVEAIERLKQQVQTAIKDLETLLASRMQYWFE